MDTRFSVCHVAMVTQGPLKRLTLHGNLYIGGYANHSSPGLLQLTKHKHKPHGAVGCMRRLSVNDEVYEMSRGAFTGDALRHVNIGMYPVLR